MYAELLKIALVRGVTGREHSLLRPVHWVVDLSQEGKPLAFSPTAAGEGGRGKRFRCPKNYHMQFKDERIQSVCTNQSNWLPDFLVGPVDEIFPRRRCQQTAYLWQAQANMETHCPSST